MIWDEYVYDTIYHNGIGVMKPQAREVAMWFCYDNKLCIF